MYEPLTYTQVKAEKRTSGEGAGAAKGGPGGSAGKAAAKQVKEKERGSAGDKLKKEAGAPAVKRERKVYDMPGQTKATPDEVR